MATPLWQRARGLFLAAIELPAQERHAFVAAETADEAVLELVHEMLDAHVRDDSCFESPEHLPAGGRPAALGPGDQFGEYEIVSVVGEGGMGIVYKAQRAGRTVALKLIRPGATSPGLRRRFAREAEVLSRLNHPGIARIHEAGAADTASGPQPYLELDFIDGAPLLEHVRRERLNFRDRLEIIILICRAVAHAHDNGVVHRDLKPSNIVIGADGSPKVLDFGVARTLDGDLVSTTLATGAGQLVGSLAYMSPEQALGDSEGTDVRADVYALGVVGYQLLVGSLPYPELSSLPQAIHQITTEEPIPISSVDPTVPEEVDVILKRALEKDKGHRYVDAGALADDLSRYLRDEPILARRAGSVVQLQRFTKRNPKLVGSVAALLIALIVLTLATARFAFLEHRGRQEVLRLSDLQRLEECVGNAEGLWPEHPDMVENLVRWIDEQAQPLRERLPLHRQALADLRAQGVQDGDRWRFDDVETQWQHDQLDQLIVGMEQLFRETPPGLFVQVEGRLEFARAIRDRSVDGAAAAQAWADAIAGVRSSVHYDGLELQPQVGFLPLGPDPVSGLWEFAHLRTGEPPRRGSDGTLSVGPESGLVFVLIPPGEFWFGAQAQEPGARNYDVYALPLESPVKKLRVGAFLLSKYEMPQGVWYRFTGKHPSLIRGDLLPVEKVSWLQCQQVLWQMGLGLPDEVQWEYAARAGTTTPWWTGSEARSLAGAVNIADRSYCNRGPKYRKYEMWLEDGYAGVPAPVHHYRPNPFGLHNILGNVWEWCREAQPDPSGRDWAGLLPHRGGSWDSPAEFVRCSKRGRSAPTDQNHFTGVRPACELTLDGDP